MQHEFNVADEKMTAEQQAIVDSELKEDLLLIQFKLINKKNFKTVNTFSFINVPLNKVTDNNVSTLLEIMKKTKKQQRNPKRKTNAKSDFMPYNKSILTRVIAMQLQKYNVLVLSHFSKKSVTDHFKNSSGPAKNLFNQIDSIFGEDPYICDKKKLNHQQALKLLQSKFKKDTAQIFGQLEQFRDGTKSMEVYTQQAAASLPKAMAIKGSVTPNMFNQILQYLNFKDEII